MKSHHQDVIDTQSNLLKNSVENLGSQDVMIWN